MLTTIGSLTLEGGPDNLINGTFPQVTQAVTMAPSDTPLKRGTLLGHAGGKYAIAKKDTNPPSCILAEDWDGKASKALVYLTGQFNSRVVILGDGLTLVETTEELRRFSIFLSPSVSRGT